MSKEQMTGNEKLGRVPKPAKSEPAAEQRADPGEQNALASLQQQVGNRAVQRLIAQRSGGEGAYELDDDTAGRIKNQRGGGQPLDANVQAQMSAATGGDYRDVRVHTSGEAHELNEQVNAEAFTTGNDIFFREGAYRPDTSSGQELLAHELSHVDQQRSGRVGGGSGSGKMTVNAPDDSFEQEADTIAGQVTNAAAAPSVQRAAPEEEEPLQGKLQRQEVPEEREEEVQAKHLQRAALEEEEPLQGKLQRQEEPEDREEQSVG